jgi:hypothetical protein
MTKIEKWKDEAARLIQGVKPMKYILSGNKKAPIKYIKTGCDLYIEEICCELNGHSNNHDALVAMNKELVEALGVTINIINIEHQERLSTKLCSTREHALGTATIILAKAKELNHGKG